MRKVLILALALLMLAGCGKHSQETPATQPEPQADPGWYIPESEAEKSTNGAVRTYELRLTEKVTGIDGISDKLLVRTQRELTVLSGENAAFFAGITPDFASDRLQPTSQGVAYYESRTNEMVYLDKKLQVISRIALPETIDGTAFTTPDAGEIYYSVGGDIRAFDTNLNIARLVKSRLVKSQTLEGLYFGGRMLLCAGVLENGGTEKVYLRTDNGETLSTDDSLELLQTYGDHYIALQTDGTVRQVIFGTKDTEPGGIATPEDAVVVPAAELGGVVAYKVDENHTLTLDFIECATGMRTSGVALANVAAPVDVYADPLGRCLWFVAEDLADGVQKLYRWDTAKSAVTDDTNYTATIYTPESPDAVGLELCQEKAKKIGKAHGVKIAIFQDAVKETGDYTVALEHHPNTITAVLEELEKVLPEYPDKFLKGSVHKDLHICIVRSVDGGKQSAHHYKKSHAYIFLPVGCDVRSQLLKSMGYIVNSRVVSNTSMLDTWTMLNPEGFQYGEGKAEYLEGEQRAFADMDAMNSVVEDRARIFRYAMEEGNSEMFSSETMQSKLKLLCQGIRKVWKWRKEEVSYPWEQYLTESLAYKKK